MKSASPITCRQRSTPAGGFFTKNWTGYSLTIMEHLNQLSFRDREGNELGADEGFQIWCDHTKELKRTRNRIFFIGNGASASMASHIAADLAKNAHILTEVFFDLSLMTALANDIRFEAIFSEPLSWKMQTNDMLVAISSSGNSPNIVEAVHAARTKNGRTVTLSAMSGDNTIRSLGDLNLYLPADTYGLAESCHASVLHYWVDCMAG